MNYLPTDLLEKVINNILFITDIRKLTQTCVLFNKLCKPYINKLEVKYMKNNKSYTFSKYLNNYCIEKFTIEITLDGYYELLDKKFYRKKNKIICSMLAFCGQEKLLCGAISKKCNYDEYTLMCSIFANTDVIFTYLVKKIYGKLSKNYPHTDIVRNIGLSGNIHILKWIYKNKLEHLLENQILYDNAAYNDKLDIIIWSYNNIGNLNSIYDSKFVNTAAYKGYLNIIIWAHNVGYIKDNSFYYKAIKYGHVNIIEWAFQNNYANINLPKIIKSDNLNVLEWFIQHNKIIVDDKIHILIDNKVRVKKYNNISSNKQKIICCSNDGEIIIHDINCINNCKILFYIMSHDNKSTKIIKWINNNIAKCHDHNWSVQYLNCINL